MEIKITKNDADKELNGIWQEYFGVEFRIARFRNNNFMRQLRQKSKGRRVNLDIYDAHKNKVIIEVMADTILLEWKNLFINGQEIPYNRDNAISLLTNDKDCLDFISTISMDMENYLLDDEEDLVGE